jgi:hypothetical protein
VDKYLVFHSDDGFKLVVKVNGVEVYTFNRLNTPQHLPNVDGNPPATQSLHRVPFLFKQGVEYSLVIDYRNQIYGGETDIDGITVFAMRAFPAEIIFLDMGGNRLILLHSVHASELERLAGLNLSKAQLWQALNTSLFRLRVKDMSAPPEGYTLELRGVDEAGATTDLRFVLLKGSPMTSDPIVTYHGELLEPSLVMLLEQKGVNVIHNDKIVVSDDKGNLVFDPDEDATKSVVSGISVKQNTVTNRIIFEASAQEPLIFKMNGSGNLQSKLRTDNFYRPVKPNANAAAKVPAVLSWDFNTDKDKQVADQGSDQNKLEFGATNWPNPQSPSTGHQADKDASVDPSAAVPRNKGGSINKQIFYRDRAAQGVQDDANTITLVHDNTPANHRKSYTVRGVFGFNNEKTPQELWEDGNREPYQLKGAVAGQYRAYDFTLRVALEKFVGPAIGGNVYRADGTVDFAAAKEWMRQTFNIPQIADTDLVGLTIGQKQLPLPANQSEWQREVYTDDQGKALDQPMTVAVKLGVMPQDTNERRDELGKVAAQEALSYDIVPVALNGGGTINFTQLWFNPPVGATITINSGGTIVTFLGHWVQMRSKATTGTYMVTRAKKVFDGQGGLAGFVLLGIAVAPNAFTFTPSITQDEIQAMLIHEFKHLRQFQDIDQKVKAGQVSPYWLVHDCVVHGSVNPFFEIEAYLEQMIDPRVSYRFMLKTGVVTQFVTYYQNAVAMVDNPNHLILGYDRDTYAEKNKAARDAALKILEQTWRIIRKSYPELQKGGYEHQITKPKPRTKWDGTTKNLQDEQYLQSWDN